MTVSFIVFQNIDLQRHIYSFGYPELRTHMKNICKQINTDESLIDLNNWVNDINLKRLNGGGLISLDKYIRKNCSKHDIIAMYDICKRCHCCTRHACYKPKLFQKQKNSKLQPNPYYIKENIFLNDACPCICRHISRFLYRAYWYTKLN